ncbi:MAG: N-acetyltransferase family protein [Actinomycetota bacterium]|nr:N-acetyltransferase family protein [Actinomycetota bacterium]
MVNIRPARGADAAAIAAIYAPSVSDSAASFELVPPSAEEMGNRIQRRPRLPWLVAQVQDEVVGYAYAGRHHERAAYGWSADCSVYIAAGSRRHGVGRALYVALFAELRQLGYVSVFAGIALPNASSVALHERMGFATVGIYPNAGFKFGRWHDVGWWWLRLTPTLPTDPPLPREWSPASDSARL